MHEDKIGVKNIFPIITFLMGGVFSIVGFTKYGFWNASEGPMPGFFPSLVGIALCFVSVLAFAQSFTEKTESSKLYNWYPVICTLAIILACLVVGMYISIAVFLISWLRFYEKCSWKTTLIVFIIMMTIVIGAFGLWLEVPFPKGLLFNHF